MPKKNHSPFRGKALYPANNCTLRLRGLPSSTSYSQVFTAIKNTGAIRHCSIVPDGVGSITATALIRYFRRTSAYTLYDLLRHLMLRINGVCPIVEWDLGINPELPAYHLESRGLRIRGSPSVVNYRVLEEFWSGRVQWTRDCYTDSGQGEVVYFFTSWDEGSNVARQVLQRDLRGLITVEYAIDPVD